MQTYAGFCCFPQKRDLSEAHTFGIGKNCPGMIISSVQEPLGGLVVNGRKYLDCGPLYFHISKPANKVMLWNSGWEKWYLSL